MRVIAKILFGMIFLIAPHVWANPPSGIDLDYDQEKKVLHIEVQHITKDPRKHYIRRLYIFKNEEEIEDFPFAKQTSTAELIQDVTLDLSPKDVIRVKAVCNQAGTKEETLVIPDDKSQEK